jgi:3-hydroxyacyl-[acyl-carrier-protein] dehydratase
MSALEMAPEVAAAFRAAMKTPLCSTELRTGEPLLDSAGIEARIPHRGPFLLLDRVHAIDTPSRSIVASYDLARAADVLAGHFPAHPVWPGVLQIEAVGQAGLVLHRELSADPATESVALTHVLGARFIGEVTPGGSVEIHARIWDDGLFMTIVGQCLQDRRICSVAAVSAL